jgi:hypothetical protein
MSNEMRAYMVMKWKELDGENGCNLLKSTTLEYNWRD